jgi:hypothetical protein
MPLAPCETCGKSVSATAEVCPHCGQSLPEKLARVEPDKWLSCPKCQSKNRLGNDACWACRGDIADIAKGIEYERWSARVFRQRTVYGLVFCSILGVVYGCIGTPHWPPRSPFDGIFLCPAMMAVLGYLGGVAFWLGDLYDHSQRSKK